MKLLLTSAGLSTDELRDTFTENLTKTVADVQVQVLYVGFEHPDFESFIDTVKQRFIETGVDRENIRLFDLRGDGPPSLVDVDVVLMFGGNEHHYVHHIRRLGLVSGIREFVDSDRLYIGISAGSIIMGPDVNLEHWSMASNDIGLEDTRGSGTLISSRFPTLTRGPIQRRCWSSTGRRARN